MPATTDTNPLVYIRSDKDTHFTGGLAQHEFESESISFPNEVSHTNEVIIEGIAIQSDQNLEWDIYIWTGVEYDNTDLDLDKFLEYVNFASTSGKQIGSPLANQYYYSKTGLSIRYKDGDNTKKLHCSLVNRSATAKNAGATGEVVVQFTVSPIYFV
ncbi:MAG: hypothetical protein AB1478_04985 [Nitrospirota bacterium]